MKIDPNRLRTLRRGREKGLTTESRIKKINVGAQRTKGGYNEQDCP